MTSNCRSVRRALRGSPDTSRDAEPEGSFRLGPCKDQHETIRKFRKAKRSDKQSANLLFSFGNQRVGSTPFAPNSCERAPPPYVARVTQLTHQPLRELHPLPHPHYSPTHKCARSSTASL